MTETAHGNKYIDRYTNTFQLCSVDVVEHYTCFGILKDLASLRHHAKNTYVPLFQLNLNQDFTVMTTLFTVKNIIASIFVPLIYKYVRQVKHFKSKPNVLVSGSIARLAHVLDNIFITVCQQTLLAQWAACYGPNGTTGWMDQSSHDMKTESESWHDNISTAISEMIIYIYIYVH